MQMDCQRTWGTKESTMSDLLKRGQLMLEQVNEIVRDNKAFCVRHDHSFKFSGGVKCICDDDTLTIVDWPVNGARLTTDELRRAVKELEMTDE